jgi:HlyD family secretion protein
MRVIQWMIISSVLALSACSHHSSHYLGYVEGEYVYLASPVAGQLVKLAVKRGDTVKPDQLAFELDPQPELSQLNSAKAQLEQAQKELDNLRQGERTTIIKRFEAQLSQAEANLVYSKKMSERNNELVKTGAIGKAAADQAHAQYLSDEQKVKEARANLSEAQLGARTNVVAAQESRVKSAESQVQQYEWMVAQKTVRFAQGGFIQNTLFRQDEFVPAGKPVVSLLPPENRLLVFFVPEKELSHLKIGQSISFTCDGCQKNMAAHIYYISSRAEYTPPVIYSENTRANLVYWIEAKIDPSVVLNMHPGQPVQVNLEGNTQ